MRTTSFDFDEIGTHWRIDIPSDTPLILQKKLLKKIISLIDDFDKIYSRFREDSLVIQMSKKKGRYILPDNSFSLIMLYEELYNLTKGAFTPLIGQTLVDAGYDAQYSLIPKKIKNPPAWEDVMSYRNSILTLKKPALLDFGACGKGYLIDLVSELLKKDKVNSFCVDAGGDIYYANHKKNSLPVGLEDPDDPTQVIGSAFIYNQSICASAGNRRRWGRFHHIIDPYTLSSPSKIKATWTIAESSLLADALTTCLFFTKADVLLNKYDFSYLIIFEDNSFEVSKDFPGEIFKSGRIKKSI